MTTTTQRKERRDRISLGISAASLALGVAGLLLNEKPQEVTKMNNGRNTAARARSGATIRTELPPAKSKKELRDQKKDLKNRYRSKIQSEALDTGYLGKVIVMNREGIEETYKLVPLGSKAKPPVGPSAKKNATKPSAKKAPVRKSPPVKHSSAMRSAPVPKKSWVAMEINARDGSGVVAVTCDSKDDAADMCRQFARSHRAGSIPDRFCIQRYAYLDTSKPVDVADILLGSSKITTYGI